ncbi:MAG: alkaline phosphatase D family protein [Alphaproteobacteria bacterium]|nr:alkaline phosphatase D family protein [Alphaproteobacteria bacterium]
MTTRRRLLLTAGGALAAPALLRFPVAWAAADPFALGVASGDPWPDSVVLWTRLILGDPGTPPPDAASVQWELAEDDGFHRVVRRGEAVATPELGHAVHVVPAGLHPGRWYSYRFHHAGATSPVGRARTAPAPGVAPETFSFAFASCQQYEQGFYAAHRHMAAEELDLVLFLGDYIYEISYGREKVRQHDAPTPKTLADYRRRYALYKSDRDLQASHAACPWSVTWDDHEVANDYASDRSETLAPRDAFVARRAAAYPAFYEHMPLRPAQRPNGPDAQLYRVLRFGDMASVLLTDDRQYRSYHACPKPGRGGSNVVGDDCAERFDPGRTMLGAAQERWMADTLAKSKARFTIIAQQTLVAQLDENEGQGRKVWTEAWDGYPAARQRMIDAIADSGAANPIIVGGDMHTFYAADAKRDYDRPESATVATEFVGGSITSQAPGQNLLDRWIKNNPHMYLAEGRLHGYGRCVLTRRGATVDLRALDDHRRADSAIRSFKTYDVEPGRPGIHPRT